MKDSISVTSIDNTFMYCYTAKQGSIFTLDNVPTFTEIGSLYQYNAGVEGGVIYCINGCGIDIGANTRFFDINALNGGLIYGEGQMSVTMDTVFI